MKQMYLSSVNNLSPINEPSFKRILRAAVIMREFVDAFLTASNVSYSTPFAGLNISLKRLCPVSCIFHNLSLLKEQCYVKI